MSRRGSSSRPSGPHFTHRESPGVCLCLLVGSQAALGGGGRRGMKVNPKGEGAAETGTPLEQVVNALEAATGIDLDGDVSASRGDGLCASKMA